MRYLLPMRGIVCSLIGRKNNVKFGRRLGLADLSQGFDDARVKEATVLHRACHTQL
jgi:hypothetical protein